MEYLIVLAGALALLLLIILVFNKGKRTEHWFLSAILFFVMVSCYYVFEWYHHGPDFYIPIVSEINYAIPLLYGTLLWFYTRSLINKEFQLKWYDAAHLLPFLIFLSFLLALLITQEETFIPKHLGYPLIKLVINPIYIFLSLRLLYYYRKTLLEEYSYIDHMYHYWLSWIAYGGLLLWVVACLGNIFDWFNQDNPGMMGDYFVISCLAVLLFILAYVGFHRTQIFQSPEKAILPSLGEKRQRSVDSESVDHSKTYETLADLMTQDKPYLDPQLSLNKLASVSGIPAGRLSTVINQVAHVNFYDFINGYRVDERQAQADP